MLERREKHIGALEPSGCVRSLLVFDRSKRPFEGVVVIVIVMVKAFAIVIVAHCKCNDLYDKKEA